LHFDITQHGGWGHGPIRPPSQARKANDKRQNVFDRGVDCRRRRRGKPVGAVYALGQSATTSDPTDAGKAVFKRANCFGCHKWHGNGGGG